MGCGSRATGVCRSRPADPNPRHRHAAVFKLVELRRMRGMVRPPWFMAAPRMRTIGDTDHTSGIRRARLCSIPQMAEDTEQVHDSSAGWVNEHIQRYVESDGERGRIWRGVDTLLLTTRGRKSGLLRRTALIFGEDGGNYLVVASKGGAAKHPNWYLNLAADPNVEVQVGANVFRATARTATPDEKPKLWERMAAIWPAYDDYQRRTKRDIPIVILEPERSSG
jgi:deazaflavin-dependent oxidoreductase (nitroreductase family)